MNEEKFDASKVFGGTQIVILTKIHPNQRLLSEEYYNGSESKKELETVLKQKRNEHGWAEAFYFAYHNAECKPIWKNCFTEEFVTIEAKGGNCDVEVQSYVPQCDAEVKNYVQNDRVYTKKEDKEMEESQKTGGKSMGDKVYLSVGAAWDSTNEKGKKFIAVELDDMKGEKQSFRLYDNKFKQEEKDAEKKKHLPDYVLLATREKAAELGLEYRAGEETLANIGGGWIKEMKNGKGSMVKVSLHSGDSRADLNLLTNAYKQKDTHPDYVITASEDDAKVLGLKAKVFESKKKSKSDSMTM